VLIDPAGFQIFLSAHFVAFFVVRLLLSAFVDVGAGFARVVAVSTVSSTASLPDCFGDSSSHLFVST